MPVLCSHSRTPSSSARRTCESTLRWFADRRAQSVEEKPASMAGAHSPAGETTFEMRARCSTIESYDGARAGQTMLCCGRTADRKGGRSQGRRQPFLLSGSVQRSQTHICNERRDGRRCVEVRRLRMLRAQEDERGPSVHGRLPCDGQERRTAIAFSSWLGRDREKQSKKPRQEHCASSRKQAGTDGGGARSCAAPSSKDDRGRDRTDDLRSFWHSSARQEARTAGAAVCPSRPQPRSVRDALPPSSLRVPPPLMDSETNTLFCAT